jgi:hypothetical protein
VDGDVGEGVVGGEFVEGVVESGWGEVPDVVVVDAEVGEDLLEAGAAFEGELDLDRDPFGCAEDGVGEVVLGAPVGAGAAAAGERAFALPGAEVELVFEQEADVGDGLEVGDEAVVGLPGAEAAAGDACAAACEPEEGGQVDGEAGGAGPAGVDPAVAQAAGGAVAAADQEGELVECERVLLCDQAEQLPVPVGDLVAAFVSACSPALFLLLSRERLLCQCRSPPLSVGYWSCCVLPLPPPSGWALLPWWVTS